MKIYTKTGDRGETSLFSGKRLSKDDLRIEAYGTIDELNSHLGVLTSLLKSGTTRDQLIRIQSQLFVTGSHLACEPDFNRENLPKLDAQWIKDLETWIDEMELKLEALRHFVLPGGSLTAAHCHICRTVCRRAERRIVSLSQVEKTEFIIIEFTNRLSDYFFVLSRFLNKQEGKEEIFWIP